MSIKSWFGNIKKAITCGTQSNKNFSEYVNEKNKIYPLEYKNEMPNLELEQQIGISICGIEYCTEDWLGGPVPDHSDNVTKKCDDFTPNGEKCANTACPVYAAHCAYFCAKDTYNTTIAARNNAIKHVFGIREK